MRVRCQGPDRRFHGRIRDRYVAAGRESSGKVGIGGHGTEDRPGAPSPASREQSACGTPLRALRADTRLVIVIRPLTGGVADPTLPGPKRARTLRRGRCSTPPGHHAVLASLLLPRLRCQAPAGADHDLPAPTAGEQLQRVRRGDLAPSSDPRGPGSLDLLPRSAAPPLVSALRVGRVRQDPKHANRRSLPLTCARYRRFPALSRTAVVTTIASRWRWGSCARSIPIT
jgi:hypothetical protein